MRWVFLIVLPFFILANNITIYNNNLAFVKEEKNISVEKKVFFIDNLSFDIIDSSISLDTKDLNILSYELHKPSSFINELLKINLNKEVKFTINKTQKEGKLIAIKPQIVVEDKEKNYYIINNPTTLIFKNFITTYKKNPFLKVKVASNEDKNSTILLKYLINGLSWKSNYIINLHKKTLDLKAFIEINNHTLKSFNNYNISFLAGSLNRAYIRAPKMAKTLALESEEVEIKPSKIDSYYLYKLPYKESIPKKSKKFFKLFEVEDIKYKAYYQTSTYFFNRYIQNLKFIKTIEFKNTNTLNEPLPQGVVRVYKKDIYLGQDYIKNSPKNSDIKIKTGIEFDLKGKKEVLEYIENKKYKKQKVKYSITNSSNEPKVVKIVEKIPTIASKEIRFQSSCKDICSIKKIDAFSKEYNILLKPNSKYNFTSTYEIFY